MGAGLDKLAPVPGQGARALQDHGQRVAQLKPDISRRRMLTPRPASRHDAGHLAPVPAR